jgi:transposase
VVPITGTNAKRVLFGAIDLRTAHRIVLIRRHAGQVDAQAFLSELRRRYRRAGQIWLLADRASAHTAPQTLAVAAQLRIRFLWLPKQAPELSPMDQLWRELKRLIAANRQAESIDALADNAAEWLLTLTPQQARRKAGMTSKRFWLKGLLQHLWLPTYTNGPSSPSELRCQRTGLPMLVWRMEPRFGGCPRALIGSALRLAP